MVPASCYMQIALRSCSVQVRWWLFSGARCEVLRASCCCGTVCALVLCASLRVDLCECLRVLLLRRLCVQDMQSSLQVALRKCSAQVLCTSCSVQLLCANCSVQATLPKLPAQWPHSSSPVVIAQRASLCASYPAQASRCDTSMLFGSPRTRPEVPNLSSSLPRLFYTDCSHPDSDCSHPDSHPDYTTLLLPQTIVPRLYILRQFPDYSHLRKWLWASWSVWVAQCKWLCADGSVQKLCASCTVRNRPKAPH